MENKTEITYWLSPAGEKNPTVMLLSTITSKVPEVGEVIGFDTRFDRVWGEGMFRHLSEEQMEIMFPKEDTQILGKFLVVNSQRFIREDWYACESDKLFNTSTAVNLKGPKLPVSRSIETFEITIEPFRETELTETPIAKLRNLMGPIFSAMDMVNLISEHPDKEKELMELLRTGIETNRHFLDKAREFIRDDKNWK